MLQPNHFSVLSYATECKLSSACYDILFKDMHNNSVDFVRNFDGNEVEPLVLPARLPLLLLNGASGIAVGMVLHSTITYCV